MGPKKRSMCEIVDYIHTQNTKRFTVGMKVCRFSHSSYSNMQNHPVFTCFIYTFKAPSIAKHTLFNSLWFTVKRTDRRRRRDDRNEEGWSGSEGEPGWEGMWAVIDVFVSLEAKESHCS